MPRVLIVDDEVFMTQLIVNILKRMKAETVACSHAADAVGEVADGHFDLLITDMLMPDMSGLELCRTVRNDMARAQLKILMITSKPLDAGESQELEEMGVCLMRKPFTPVSLIERVKSLTE